MARAGRRPAESAWTGRHDAAGNVFPAERDWLYAWSAAFTSYVMRTAGAREGFPYSAAHSTYVNAARTGAPGLRMRAERPEVVRAARGRPDLPGTRALGGHALRRPPRRLRRPLRSRRRRSPGTLTVVGGNVDDAVTTKHVPVTEQGTLAEPDGQVVDVRYPWFVVVRVLYDD